MMHHAGMAPGGAAASFATRRLIFLDVPGAGDPASFDRSALFAVGAVRVPRFFVDVDMHQLKVLDVHELGPGTGWGRVPTPMF